MFRALLASIRNLGDCPCPRCLTPLTLAHEFGTPQDKLRRVNEPRIDDKHRQKKVSGARKLIYGKLGVKKNANYAVNSAAVERLLKEQSLVPTDVCLPSSSLNTVLISNYIQNAFSKRLASFKFNLFPMFIVDLLHEVELGVWRSLFIHLLRIMECIGPTLAHKLDERFVST